jgi:hypothetical protein
MKMGRGLHSLLLPLAALTAVFFAMGCGGEATKPDFTGGSDDVENPAITVALRDPQGNAFGSGEVKIYARFQNPTLDTTPLLTQSVAAGTKFTLTDSMVLKAMQVAALKGVSWPSLDTVEFNILGRSPVAEAFIGNFFLARKGATKYHFHQRMQADTVRNAFSDGTLPVTLAMKSPVVGLQGKLGVNAFGLGLKSVFVAGSPYWAAVTDSTFTLARIAVGRYPLKAMSLDGKVYEAANPLNTDSAYTAENWAEGDLIWIEQ